MLRKTYNVHVTINSPEKTSSKNPCDSDSDDSLFTSIFDDLPSSVQCPAPPNPSSPLTSTSASPTHPLFNMSSQLPAHPSTSLPSPSPAQPSTSLQSPAQPSTSLQSPAQPSTSLQSPAQPSTSLQSPARPSTSLQSPARPCISLTSPTCSKPSTTDDSDDEETTVLVTSPTSSSWRSKYSDLITKEELKCLQEGEKLNDLIIDASLNYIMFERCQNADSSRLHIMSTLFYTRISNRVKNIALKGHPAKLKIKTEREVWESAKG
ncbi:vegetative cell wall protein gp1, partial [Exaiptasia diaphana]|uniref:Uncharacterized protein n=1 Tax=Exaiptasia diaphana TaxID=2652724 RepID=A0A913XRW9_EXADI